MSFWTEALGAEIKFYDAGGWRTRAIEAGAGEPVILMHGVSGHAETFIRNVVPLADAGFHVYAIDAIGHGFSAKPTDVTYYAPLFREHLKRFMDAIGAEKAHLVGQSLGGWTALDFARAYPERAASIVSLTGAGILLDDAASQRASEDVHRRVQSVTQAAVEMPTLESVKKRLQWLMADPSTVPDELVETRYRIMMLPDSRKSMPKLVAEMPGEGNRAHMIREADLKKIATRTLIVWSDKNPTTPAAVGERAAKLMPNARFELVKNAGHWPQYEQPKIVNELIAAFLRSVRIGARAA